MRKLRWKKNKFSYVFWCFFCAGVLAAFLPGCVCIAKDGVGVVHEAVSYGAALLFMLLTVKGFLFLRDFLLKRQKEITGKMESGFQKTERVLACILVLFMAGIHVWHAVKGSGIPVGGSELYEAAEVSGNNTLPYDFPGLFSLYVCLLRAVFLFLGNKPEFVVFVQVFLSVLSGLIFYGIVRKLAGRGTGLLFLALWAFWPGTVYGLTLAQPDFLLCIIIGITLLVMLRWFESVSRRKKRAVFLGIAAGIFTGIALWADVFGVCLLLIGTACLLLLDTEAPLSGKLYNGLCFLFGCTAGVAVLFGAGLYGGIWTVSELLYLCESRYFGSIILQIPVFILDGRCFFVFGCCIFGGFALCSFFVRKWDSLPVLAILLTGLFLVGGSGADAGYYSAFAGFVWLLAGCLGIQYFVDLYYEKETSVEKVKMPEIKMSKKGENGVRLIPNPLPGPKKHVKRELDFAIEPEKDKMKFDVALTPENDDFDI